VAAESHNSHSNTKKDQFFQIWLQPTVNTKIHVHFPTFGRRFAVMKATPLDDWPVFGIVSVKLVFSDIGLGAHRRGLAFIRGSVPSMKMNFINPGSCRFCIDGLTDLTEAAKINYEKTGSRPV
jgi:hypothetical protein